jgi:hypothetical protein
MSVPPVTIEPTPSSAGDALASHPSDQEKQSAQWQNVS